VEVSLRTFKLKCSDILVKANGLKEHDKMVSCIISPIPTNSKFLEIFSLIFIVTFVINQREPLLPETLIICLMLFLSFNFSEMVKL